MRWLVFICLLSVWSCGPEDADARRAERIRESVAERIEEYRAYRVEQCKAEAVRIAKDSVDAYFIEIDRMNEGRKTPYRVPVKPVRPEVRYPADTGSVRPIFDTLPD